MFDSKEMILTVMQAQGKADAEKLQEKAGEMTNMELYAERYKMPAFRKVLEKTNMLQLKAGQKDGFVCVSSAGTVCRLLQNYDSAIFTGEPEKLPAQWGRVWSDDPAEAKEFTADANSPYHKGNCCMENGQVFRSKMDGNVHPPSAYPDGWEPVA